MDSFLQVGAVKKNKKCNCISPFFLSTLNGINPNTGRNYTDADKQAIKATLIRSANASQCEMHSCCSPNATYDKVDQTILEQVKARFPYYKPLYTNGLMDKILLASNPDTFKNAPDWKPIAPYVICKIAKATIKDTDDPDVKEATNILNDCYLDTCDNNEPITLNNLIANSRKDMSYTYFDDARVAQSILDGNETYLREYIRKYNNINSTLTHNDLRQRIIHLAAESNTPSILTLVLALKPELNSQDADGNTPIIYAIKAKNINNVQELINQGADMKIKNNAGDNAMFIAVKTGRLDIIRLLYNNGGSILETDNKGNNIIHQCILYCPTTDQKPKIMQYLIERGANTEAKTNDGYTPLELVKHILDSYQLPSKYKIGNVQGKKMTPSDKKKMDVVSQHKLEELSQEEIVMLEIQSMIFNNILSNNPNKYSGYINVTDIPKGAPITVLDTLCVGRHLTGSEDSEECVKKGGYITKVENPTTRIKLEMMPVEESKINEIPDNKLYYAKYGKKITDKPIPSIVKYNEIVSKPMLTIEDDREFNDDTNNNLVNDIDTDSTWSIKNIIIVIVVLLLIVIGIISFFLYMRSSNTPLTTK